MITPSRKVKKYEREDKKRFFENSRLCRGFGRDVIDIAKLCGDGVTKKAA
jgi:hypothetical protein